MYCTKRRKDKPFAKSVLSSHLDQFTSHLVPMKAGTPNERLTEIARMYAETHPNGDHAVALRTPRNRGLFSLRRRRATRKRFNVSRLPTKLFDHDGGRASCFDLDTSLDHESEARAKAKTYKHDHRY